MTIVNDDGTVVQQGDTGHVESVIHVEKKTSRQSVYVEKLPAI